MAKQPASDPSTQPTFDERLQRLEALVAELEQGGGGLEAALARYAEGVKLLKDCRDSLAMHKKTVEELTASGTRPVEEWEGPAGKGSAQAR